MGAKMTPFCGWNMPLIYKDSSLDSHNHCRTNASVFDVSHMGQVHVTGPDRVAFLEKLIPADLGVLSANNAKLCMLTNEKGGINDDLVISNHGDYFYVVLNAGCKDKDLAHIRAHLADFKGKGGRVDVTEIMDHSLIALQGPKAMTALSRLATGIDLTKVPFMTGHYAQVQGVKCLLTRCGYTGEDGFEISIPSSHVNAITRSLLGMAEVKPAGLGARDSLRLEAGLCLYGNDINEDISPIEAGLAFCIGKGRRERGGFLGSDVILGQLKDKSKVTRKRVGFSVVKGAPVRDGADVTTPDGKKVGMITSGCFSPTLKKPIAMGYVSTAFAAAETPLKVVVRGKEQDVIVSKMPLVPTRYYKP
eukprot:TRINITY_DN2590_c0_g1::TRINITY_DN2590_c0_g1_i2::g.19196::m.19196 TRINITY_DN2590_c0_g1::TRINITY_DN2590_c0_g1_i2::g.19196  ORF type:complete len:418 (+),score=140.76,sp/P49364/GCST_PEA/51.26/5e-129,GCV_T/PF01571.16/7.4e-66,GCV_T_C/PF08669.6/4.2e-23,SoxG/PF04268.7/11,SoxG/PF04268.7/0.048 TRINITY_DN2590_c0_g1_i2:170-1255(+)